jgi:AraC-like DNA-binding protein
MDQPSFNSWTIIFLIAAVQGYFLSAILFFLKKGNVSANKTLALLILCFSLQMTFYVMFWTGYNQAYPWMNFWVEPLVFLAGPLLYLYILKLDSRKLPPKYFFHFLPAIIIFIFHLPFILRNLFGRIEFLRNYFFLPLNDWFKGIFNVIVYMQITSLTVYAVIISIYILNDKRKLNAFALDSEKLKHRWLQRITFLYIGFVIAFISYYILAFTQLIRPEYDYAISACMTLFIYTVGYMGFRQPAIFNEVFEVETIPNSSPMIKIHQREAVVKYQNSVLTNENASAIAARLKILMDEKKPYLDNSLKIQHLAEQLNVSTHQLSQVINSVLHQSYSDLVNRYRIEEAKKLLLDPGYKEKILSIAFDVGYSNKATFNIAFKKIAGTSPSEYRKIQLQKGVA